VWIQTPRVEFSTAEGGCAPMSFESVIESSRELLLHLIEKTLDILTARFYHFLEKVCLPARDPGCAVCFKTVHLSPTFVSVTHRPATPQEGYRYGLDQT